MEKGTPRPQSAGKRPLRDRIQNFLSIPSPEAEAGSSSFSSEWEEDDSTHRKNYIDGFFPSDDNNRQIVNDKEIKSNEIQRPTNILSPSDSLNSSDTEFVDFGDEDLSFNVSYTNVAPLLDTVPSDESEEGDVQDKMFEDLETSTTSSERRRASQIKEERDKKLAAALAASAILKKDQLVKTEEAEPMSDEIPEESETFLASTERRRANQIREERDKKLAAALAAGAVLKKDHLIQTEHNFEKPKPIMKEPKRMVELRSTEINYDKSSARASNEQSNNYILVSDKARELKNRKREAEALLTASREKNETLASEDTQQSKNGQVEPSNSSRSGANFYTYIVPKRQKSNVDLYNGESIAEEEMSNNSSDDVKAKPQNFSMRGSAPLDIFGLQGEKSEYHGWGSRKQVILINLLILLLWIVIVLPVYFLFFNARSRVVGKNSTMNSPTKSPAMPPSQSGPEPQIPTMQPASRPNLAPSAPNPANRLQVLYDFLVPLWPSLADDFADVTSPQLLALEWLSENANFDSYEEEILLQRFVMATLYFSTGGSEWLQNDLWLSDVNECLWYTSTNTRPPCNEAGLLTNLELDLNDLSGTIPSELALLSDNLRRIDFTRVGVGPSLSGSMPSALGMLTRLEFVSLKGNKLTRSLPREIGNWQQVNQIDLSYNFLIGTVPSEIASLSELTHLDLTSNFFTGNIPTTIGRLSNMRKLHLGSNYLEGPIPSEIGNMRVLEAINVEMNQLTSLPSEIGNLVSLHTLEISNNEIQGTIPSEIGNLASILNLNLASNSFTGAIPSEIGNLVMIRSE